ncbi:hypothetical protein CPB86DRAFT_794707 [Serendipita vermifera]|nr:hypothetical protein CPB86DRAFT_794707 [Serendipita vermifera]
MPHSPANSRSSKGSPKPADAIMEPFDLWIASYDDKQLRPHGQVPETEEFSRRSSNSHAQLNPALAMGQPSTSPTNSNQSSPEGSPSLGMRHLQVTLRRIEVDFKITNWEMQARSSVISMMFCPPPEIGGLVFRIDIPGKWWNEMRLTPEDVRAALRKEVVARLQGRLPEEVFVREYVKSLRADLEHCVHTLPVACFDFSLILPTPANGSGDSSTTNYSPSSLRGSPRASTIPHLHQDWFVAARPINGTAVKMVFQRSDVMTELSIPDPILQKSFNSIQDWVLLQLSE